MTEMPARVQLLDTAELCLRAGQLLTRQPEDAEAVRVAAAPITAWAAAGPDPADAATRRKAVQLVLAGMGQTLATPLGSRIRDAEGFVAAAEEWRTTLADAATMPEGHPGYAPHPGAGTGTAPGTAPPGRLMWLLRNLIVTAFAGDPEARDRLIGGAVRYGRTASQPATTGEYAAALAFLFRHDPRWQPGDPRWVTPDTSAPGPPEEGFSAGRREPPTGPQRNLAAYGDGTAEDGGGAP